MLFRIAKMTELVYFDFTQQHRYTTFAVFQGVFLKGTFGKMRTALTQDLGGYGMCTQFTGRVPCLSSQVGKSMYFLERVSNFPQFVPYFHVRKRYISLQLPNFPSSSQNFPPFAKIFLQIPRFPWKVASQFPNFFYQMLSNMV